MKRFYEKAAAAPAAEVGSLAAESGHAVLLDGRPIRTPAQAPLVVPAAPLAEAVAAEWDAQDDEVRPDDMPMMSLAATAIDRVVPQRETVAGDAAAYGGCDLLCYRAEGPEALAARQAEEWQPLLDWAADRFGVELTVTAGISPVAQDNAALVRLGEEVARYDAFPLTALHVLTTTTGSLILALAVAEGRLAPETAYRVSILDERWQAEHWGEDEEAAAQRRRLAAEVANAAHFLELVRGA